MNRAEKALLVAVAILVGLGAILSHTAEKFFRERYVIEDGPLEWLTVVAFVIAAGVLVWRAATLRKIRPLIFTLVTLAGAAVLFFGAGEEISWGQRIFGIETPGFMEEHNKQKEMNLHNLVVGEISINKLVFSKMLAVGLVIYLLVMPWFYQKKPGFAAWIDRIGIPMPKRWHIITWLVVIAATEIAFLPHTNLKGESGLEPLVATNKKGEVREFAAGFLVLAQILMPFNAWIYRRNRRPGQDSEEANRERIPPGETVIDVEASPVESEKPEDTGKDH